MHTLETMISEEKRLQLNAENLEGIIINFCHTRKLDILTLSKILTIINSNLTKDMKRREDSINGHAPF